MGLWTLSHIDFKWTVHPKMKICWRFTHPQAIKDVDSFFSIRTDLEKFSITSLAHQWILCSEWVPSEWESKKLIKHHKNPQVIHIQSKNLWSEKLCVCKRHKSIKTILNPCFWLKYESSIHGIAFSNDKVHHLLSQHWHIRTVLDCFLCKQCMIGANFLPDSNKMTFPQINQYYGWIEDSHFTRKQGFEVFKTFFFLTNMQIL